MLLKHVILISHSKQSIAENIVLFKGVSNMTFQACKSNMFII